MDSSSNQPLENLEEVFLLAYRDAEQLKQNHENQSLTALQFEKGEDRYEIEKLIGEGASKQVFLAFDRLIQRHVAYAKIKAEHRDRADDLLTEVRIASKLEHPYIAPIYDMGLAQDGLPYFVMKLYEGRSLDRECQHRRIQHDITPENLTWIIQTILKIGEALAFAHSKGVLHLDLKPSNIRIDDYGEVLLCDWGISSLIHHVQDESKSSAILPLEELAISKATLMGEIRGTPGFMAPEQKQKDHPCDQRTDIYGLGALILDTLTGSPVLQKSDTSVPKELIAIALKAKSELPQHRYPNVRSMMDDLQKFQSGQVTLAEKANWFQVMRKWLQRHQGLVQIFLINLFILCICSGFYIYLVQKSNRQLEQTLSLLHAEKEKQDQERLALAKNYFEQGDQAYKGTVSKFDFDARDLMLAKEMMVRSTQLDPDNLMARGLLGNIRLVSHEFHEALEDYALAGSEFEKHHVILSNYIDQLDESDENFLNIKIEMIRDITSTKDFYLRNHLIFREIHQPHDKDMLLEFALKSLAIVNNLEKVDYDYQESRFLLDISNNQVRTVYPLKTLPIKRLVMKHTRLSSNEIYNIRRMPLTHFDASYSKIKHLDRFTNTGLSYLSLEGNPLENIDTIAKVQVKHINIAFTKVDLTPLKNCSQLEMVTCSKDQVETLKKILGPEIEIKVLENSL